MVADRGPPVVTMISAWPASRVKAVLIRSSSSRIAPWSVTVQARPLASAASIGPFDEGSIAPVITEPGGTSSLPVERIETLGRQRTASVP